MNEIISKAVMDLQNAIAAKKQSAVDLEASNKAYEDAKAKDDSNEAYIEAAEAALLEAVKTAPLEVLADDAPPPAQPAS